MNSAFVLRTSQKRLLEPKMKLSVCSFNKHVLGREVHYEKKDCVLMYRNNDFSFDSLRRQK